ncbi:MAG: glutamate synthase, partial [Acidobacteriota bacterium]
MAELVPIPLAHLLRRAHHEWRQRQAVFDLPSRSFYRPVTLAQAWRPPHVVPPVDAGHSLDLSVEYGGGRAATPIGPAAGPHTQLAQNIALCWLAGARIIELKTVQVNDRLQLSRPCIDMATVGYNTEWSQELTLDQSLREYVKASMLIELLDASRILDTAGDGVVFDISVGYDLAGIRSAAIGHWLASIRNAHTLVEELRSEIPAEFQSLRDMAFRTAISASVTLSTFHGTPAAEIERICEFLIGELGLHTVIKLNPPMLGRKRVEHILHATLGYHDIEVNPACYDRNLPFDEAVGMVRRLQSLALRHGVGVGVKCGN